MRHSTRLFQRALKSAAILGLAASMADAAPSADAPLAHGDPLSLPGIEETIARVKVVIRTLYPELTDFSKVPSLTLTVSPRANFVAVREYFVVVDVMPSHVATVSLAGTADRSYYIEAHGPLFDSGPVLSAEERNRRIEAAVRYLCVSNGWSVSRRAEASTLKPGFIEVHFSMNGQGPRGWESSETRGFFDAARGYLRLVGFASSPELGEEVKRLRGEHHGRTER